MFCVVLPPIKVSIAWSQVFIFFLKTTKSRLASERTLHNPSEGGPVGMSSNDEIRWLPRSPSPLRPKFKIYVVYRPQIVPSCAWKRYINRAIHLNKRIISFTFSIQNIYTCQLFLSQTRETFVSSQPGFPKTSIQCSLNLLFTDDGFPLQRRDIIENGNTEFHTKGKPGEAHIWHRISFTKFLQKGKGQEELEFNFLSDMSDKNVNPRPPPCPTNRV